MVIPVFTLKFKNIVAIFKKDLETLVNPIY